MLDKKLAAMLSDQENFEWYSAYIYLGIANFYAEKNLNGFAAWFTIQTQEERDHALLFNKYLLNNGEAAVLGDIKKPDFKYEDFRAPSAKAFAHEQIVTSRINDIYAAAYDIKDFRTMQFLDWFVKEQGEEEKNTEEILKRYDLFGTDPKGLYMLDSELSARVYTAPSLVI
jgi:ferritin